MTSQVVIFDMDGTLLDSAAGISESLTQAIRQLGHDFTPAPAMHELFGPPMERIVRTLLAPYADERVTHCVALYRKHYRQFGLYQSQPFAGIEAVLQRLLGQGFILHVATSKRQQFAERMLSHWGLCGYFASINGSTADGSLDDKAKLVAQLLARLDCPPAQCCLVGDKADDMRAATANGLLAIGALWGYGSCAELSGSGAALLVETPAQLPDVLSLHLGQGWVHCSVMHSESAKCRGPSASCDFAIFLSLVSGSLSPVHSFGGMYRMASVMTWTVEYTDEFGAWWASLAADEQESVAVSVSLLEARGPALGFPHSSGINGSRHGHMRELRTQHDGRPLRTLYAFDPRRSAILLLGGDKTGDERWYEVHVPIADRLYDDHLSELKKEGLLDG